MTFHVLFMYPEIAGKPLEQVTRLFEDPRGIKHISTLAWKTKNYYSASARMEKGEGLEKQLPDDRNKSPVQYETIVVETAASSEGGQNPSGIMLVSIIDGYLRNELPLYLSCLNHCSMHLQAQPKIRRTKG
ncbi:high affinity glucose transporter [Elasticomyces elasticus]|nr:high affinity glucose transporter [Elasticomyces elasticus]KAK4895359.1 high affinity glucose transporter [Elasticomyces elasticus]